MTIMNSAVETLKTDVEQEVKETTGGMTLSNVCHILGYASIAASIAAWYMASGESAEAMAAAERFGIFIGLWAPTFFALSIKYDKK